MLNDDVEEVILIMCKKALELDGILTDFIMSLNGELREKLA